MGLVALKCPNCAGEIEFDKDKEFGFCMHCGQKIMIQEKIKQIIRVDNSHSIENWLFLTKVAYESDNADGIEKYSDKVLEVDINNSFAWLMKGSAAAIRGRFKEASNAWIKAISFSEGIDVEYVKIISKDMCHVFDESINNGNLQKFEHFEAIGKLMMSQKIPSSVSSDAFLQTMLPKYQKITNLTEFTEAFETMILLYMASALSDEKISYNLKKMSEARELCDDFYTRAQNMEVIIPDEKGALYQDQSSVKLIFELYSITLDTFNSILQARFSSLSQADIEKIQSYWILHLEARECLVENVVDAFFIYMEGLNKIFGGKMKKGAIKDMENFAFKIVNCNQ